MLSISKSTVQRIVKRGDIRPHSNALKPALTAANKKERLRWCLSKLIGDSPGTKREYQSMYNIVMIDEKWFSLTKKSQRAYLAKGEKGAHRFSQSTKFIPKFMFQGAVAKPWYNAQKECIWDGKIGIFPFTYTEPAQRNSKYRKKGDMVTKVVERVNRDESRKMLIQNIILAIMAKWPHTGHHNTIYIQQDNAKAHILQSDLEWQQHCEQPGFTFILIHIHQIVQN
ncbi:uncharacterized protein LOC110735987 [Chenopodium quinoa]|uniref:uncharacterized protein LOC110735987 n=1 Tax=Chenopodium quinoa TaxID=63459 RepID=UPI000B793FA0|nr:uncharacterized protein LOC110735987 [Chenopodium quinoa]